MKRISYTNIQQIIDRCMHSQDRLKNSRRNWLSVRVSLILKFCSRKVKAFNGMQYLMKLIPIMIMSRFFRISYYINNKLSIDRISKLKISQSYYPIENHMKVNCKKIFSIFLPKI